MNQQIRRSHLPKCLAYDFKIYNIIKEKETIKIQLSIKYQSIFSL